MVMVFEVPLIKYKGEGERMSNGCDIELGGREEGAFSFYSGWKRWSKLEMEHF